MSASLAPAIGSSSVQSANGVSWAGDKAVLCLGVALTAVAGYGVLWFARFRFVLWTMKKRRIEHRDAQQKRVDAEKALKSIWFYRRAEKQEAYQALKAAQEIEKEAKVRLGVFFL
jgi:hypothetical protein